MEANEVVNVAVPPAPVVDVAPVGVTVTSLLIGAPPLKKSIVPVAPTELLLCDETVAVIVTFVPAVAVVGPVSTLVVAAWVTVTLLVTGALGL